MESLQSMNRIEFQNILSSTSKLVSKRLLEISETYIDTDDDLHSNFNIFFKTRKNKKLLKPTLFRIVYEMFGGTNFSTLIDVAVIFELINISSYQSNASFDNKIGATSKAEKDSQFISSSLTRELVNKLIISLDIPDKLKLIFLNDVSNINERIYIAQHYDLNILTIDNYNIYKNNTKKFHTDYYQKCRLGSGYFSGICAKIAVLFACDNVELSEQVFSSTETYGALLHMINDLGDYLPNKKYPNRSYQDDLSDFNNERLTLPLFLMLTKTNTDYSDYNEFNILEHIQPYLLDSKKQIISQYRNLLKNLEFIPKSENGNLYKLLLSTLKSNKYFNQLM